MSPPVAPGLHATLALCLSCLSCGPRPADGSGIPSWAEGPWTGFDSSIHDRHWHLELRDDGTAYAAVEVCVDGGGGAGNGARELTALEGVTWQRADGDGILIDIPADLGEVHNLTPFFGAAARKMSAHSSRCDQANLYAEDGAPDEDGSFLFARLGMYCFPESCDPTVAPVLCSELPEHCSGS